MTLRERSEAGWVSLVFTLLPVLYQYWGFFRFQGNWGQLWAFLNYYQYWGFLDIKFNVCCKKALAEDYLFLSSLCVC